MVKSPKRGYRVAELQIPVERADRCTGRTSVKGHAQAGTLLGTPAPHHPSFVCRKVFGGGKASRQKWVCWEACVPGDSSVSQVNSRVQVYCAQQDSLLSRCHCRLPRSLWNSRGGRRSDLHTILGPLTAAGSVLAVLRVPAWRCSVGECQHVSFWTLPSMLAVHLQ